MTKWNWAVIFAAILVSNGCNEKTEDPIPGDSMLQVIGETMASIDDVGGSDGGYVLLKREHKIIAKNFPSGSKWERVFSELFPAADATSCFLTNTFGSCTSNQVIRDFQNCSIEGGRFSGTITYDYDDGTVD